MMNMILKYRFFLLLALILSVLLNSCDRDNNHPGYAYYPDMTDSRAYESYSENPNFENGITLRKDHTLIYKDIKNNKTVEIPLSDRDYKRVYGFFRLMDDIIGNKKSN